jgi:DNA-binding beta-propeller fold protein YncE
MYGSSQYVNRLARPKLIALALAISALLAVTATALAATGDITQPAGTAGCISETGAGLCADGHGLQSGAQAGGPVSVAVSPDGKSVYAVSFTACCDFQERSALVRLNRNTTTGAITQPAGTAGCISETGAGPCADGRALAGADAVAVSPDGKSVYVASQRSAAVARFVRNPTTGAITQPAGEAGCISQPTESGAEPCADGHGLGSPFSLTVSPDGKSVYVTGYAYGTVARLNRNPTTGAISQPAGAAGCISEDGTDLLGGICADGHGLGYFPFAVTVSPDNKSVYVAGYSGVMRLNRNTTTGAISQPAGTAGCVSEDGAGPCQNGHALEDPYSVVVSPDGKDVYVASTSSDAVTTFDRDPTTGAISQPQGNCISESGAGGGCQDGRGLNGAQGLSVSPDGKSLYLGAADSEAVARIDRRADGRISQPDGPAGCINRDGSDDCADGHGFGTYYSTAVAPGGRNVYVASGFKGSVMRFNRVP